MEKEIQNPTQEQRILDCLIKADGNWVSGNVFLRDMYISQFHARIFSLQKKGYNIEASQGTDKYGFKKYRLIDMGKLF
jgi:biotin operon repressor